MADRKATETSALQNALAGVHAALWGYGVLAPKLDGAEADRAQQSYDHYRDLRDRLSGLLIDHDVEPVAAEAGYRLPHRVTDSASARRLAAHLEHGCADVFGGLVAGAADTELRRFAAAQLTECAEREVGWGGQPGALPGLP